MSGTAESVLTGRPYGPYSSFGGLHMPKVTRKGSEEARTQLPELLDAAEKGRSTIITRRGRAVAALVPLDVYMAAGKQQSLLSVVGSGRGLWGKDSRRRIRELRDEWDR